MDSPSAEIPTLFLGAAKMRTQTSQHAIPPIGVSKLAPRRRLLNSFLTLGAVPGIAVLVLAITGVASGQVAVPSWSATGNMNTPRHGHTATLLKDGRVLVAGGNDGSNPLTTAELYSPATGTWRQTGSLNVPHDLCTATLLGTGKVLVVGGFSTAGAVVGTNTAELYDPATETWSLTGSLNTARVWNSATLLQNGQVLVVGGLNDFDNPVALSSAELYDPTTGTWRNTGTLK